MDMTFRFVPVVPLLFLLPGVGVTGFMAVRAAPGPALGVLAVFLVAWGAAFGLRLERIRRAGGVALRLDAEGVFLAGWPRSAAPQFAPWEDVAAIVLFGSAGTGTSAPPPRFVGVQLRNGVPGDFRSLRRRLDRARTRGDLDPLLRERVDEALKSVAATAEGVGVAAYVRRRDWFLNEKALRTAVGRLAPHVRVVDVDGQGDPAAWLSHREELERLAADLPDDRRERTDR
ncbi:hypothetical protein [Actinomadura kijaniata]|uniref:hypothetical protein n=1 Tax=Actinomadura kijaniata TaxID=46161 RepID=UPI000A507321|nr:hypothetical protein [Actinomadura kijaniata]